jgi:adenosylmethionine-8-amino-7-oxononanoate aminotransferase
MAGFGRTGEWFAFDAFDVKPDLFVFAKGSNSGYVPVGGVVISDDIAATFDSQVFPGGLTYSGHPLAAASIVATIDVMKTLIDLSQRNSKNHSAIFANQVIKNVVIILGTLNQLKIS